MKHMAKHFEIVRMLEARIEEAIEGRKVTLEVLPVEKKIETSMVLLPKSDVLVDESPAKKLREEFDNANYRNFGIPKIDYEQYLPPGAEKLYLGEQLLIFLNGIGVPTYTIARSVTGNWGFTLESCWAFCKCSPLSICYFPHSSLSL